MHRHDCEIIVSTQDVQEHMLIASNYHGRYALDTPDGRDITTGQRLEIRIGGQWVSGSVQHASCVSVSQGGVRASYYFESDTGECVGLCVGMIVRLL